MFKGKPFPKFSFNTVVGYSAFTFDILFCKFSNLNKLRPALSSN